MTLSVAMTRTSRAVLASSYIALFLSACGGGDAPGTIQPGPGNTLPDQLPPGNSQVQMGPPVRVTPQTADALGDSLFLAVGTLTETQLYASLGVAGDAATASPVSTPLAFDAPPLPQTNRAPVAELLREALNAIASTPAATASTPRHGGNGDLHTCAGGGTWYLELVDRDGNGTLSAGDSSEARFDNCTGLLGGTTNGTLTQDLAKFEAVLDAGVPVEIHEWDATYTFTDFTYQRDGLSQSVHGTVILDVTRDHNSGATTGSLTAPQLQVTRGQRVFSFAGFEVVNVTNEAEATFTQRFNGSISDSALGSYTVQTLEPLVLPISDSEFASFIQGTLLVTGEASTLTANFLADGSVQLEIDNDGDGVVDAMLLR